MKSILIFLIRGYQLTFSRLFPRVCRFEPTCSSYAIEALRLHGLAKGCTLIVWRVMRCSPFFSGGLDPVPPKDQPLMDCLGVNKCTGEAKDD